MALRWDQVEPHDTTKISQTTHMICSTTVPSMWFGWTVTHKIDTNNIRKGVSTAPFVPLVLERIRRSAPFLYLGKDWSNPLG